MLTQVVVDPNDPAFAHPTKPIGDFYDQETAQRLMAQTGNTYVEDSGRGWRRVVPSPKPVDIYEKMTLAALIKDNEVVIACGGGGIPVVYSGTRYHGVDAVIDKDFTAAKLAQLVEADILLILTAVDRVFINFTTPEQKALEQINLAEALGYIDAGYFAAGSMLPKVQAACEFVAALPGRKAIIGALDSSLAAIEGTSGTTIVS
jgi:carbamate kinase